MLESVASGTISSIAATTADVQIINPNPTGKPIEVHLLEILECLRELCNHITHTPDYEADQWTTKNINNTTAWFTNYKFLNTEYKTLHILVSTPCTILAGVNGISPSISLVFASAPTAGQYPVGIPFRWRYPSGTQLSLSLPTLAAGSMFPIAILYSNETGN